jgi:hypothetical protein
MVTLVDQVLHGDAAKGRAIILYEPEHFGRLFLPVGAAAIGTWVYFAKSPERTVDDVFRRSVDARSQLVVHDLLLLGVKLMVMPRS